MLPPTIAQPATVAPQTMVARRSRVAQGALSDGDAIEEAIRGMAG